MNDVSLRMVRKTACPSCGAEVPIHSRAAVQVVCPWCRSTLVRTDLKWEDVGKMAALADDLTPLRLGLRGRYGKSGFTVIGRLQKQYEDGVWNEWLLALDNKQSAWLGEGSGLYYLTRATTSTGPLPDFREMVAGETVRLNNRNYVVSDIEQATCIATEGEIPFTLPPGSTANAVDCMGEGNDFATIDYSEHPARLYTGTSLTLDQLQLEGAGEAPVRAQATAELRCAQCGSAMTRQNPESITIACANCCTVHTLSPKGKLVKAWLQAVQSLRPRLPLGRSGKLDGHVFEVVGWMKRHAGGDYWDEYLLYNPQQGIRWLIDADGHWTLMQPIAAPHTRPAASHAAIWLGGRRHKHFATYSASVRAVLGEFNWRVKEKERWTVTDYVSPPHILCSEISSREITWSQGIYMDPARVAAAFGLQKLDAPQGVAPNQPGARLLPVIIAFVASLFLAVFVGKAARSDLQPEHFNLGTLVMPADSMWGTHSSEPFELRMPRGALRVHTRTNLDNNWAAFDIDLINQDTGEVRRMSREISYYHGVDSEGAWSEGNSFDEALLSNVPAGRYVLQAYGDTSYRSGSLSAGPMIRADFSVEHAGETGNFWRLFWFLAIGPIVALLWHLHIEQRRWANSDHPIGGDE
jgi:ribosomal protein S27E